MAQYFAQVQSQVLFVTRHALDFQQLKLILTLSFHFKESELY